MKIKVIGSVSMWTRFNSASYLLDDDILMDIPNGACKYLFRDNINPMVINNVLITHFHGDHYFDVPFLFLLKSRAKDKLINIYCDSKGPKKIKKLFKLAFPNSLENVSNSINLKYCFDDIFKVNEYNVHRLLVFHGKLKPAYGYLFEKDGKSFGFTGDTSLCSGVEYLASKCSYLFCDCMFIKGNNKHMGIDNIVYLTNKYPKCKFVLSHMEDITREELKNNKIKNIIVPNDGDLIEIK